MIRDVFWLAAVAVMFCLGWFVTLWLAWYALALLYPASA